MAVRGLLCDVGEHSLSSVVFFFSPQDQNAPLVVDALVHQWPCGLLYALPPIAPISPTLSSAREECLSMILAIRALAGRDNPAPLPGAMASANTQGPAISGAWRNTSSPPREASSAGLAREWFNLRIVGFPLGVIETMQNARAPSTRPVYESKWSVF